MRESPSSTSPTLEQKAPGKSFVPTAAKAAPPKAAVQVVARPAKAPIATPKVSSPRPVPSKRGQAMENTNAKIARLCQEPCAGFYQLQCGKPL